LLIQTIGIVKNVSAIQRVFDISQVLNVDMNTLILSNTDKQELYSNYAKDSQLENKIIELKSHIELLDKSNRLFATLERMAVVSFLSCLNEKLSSEQILRVYYIHYKDKLREVLYDEHVSEESKKMIREFMEKYYE
jgi:hypothetical protein